MIYELIVDTVFTTPAVVIAIIIYVCYTRSNRTTYKQKHNYRAIVGVHYHYALPSSYNSIAEYISIITHLQVQYPQCQILVYTNIPINGDIKAWFEYKPTTNIEFLYYKSYNAGIFGAILTFISYISCISDASCDYLIDLNGYLVDSMIVKCILGIKALAFITPSRYLTIKSYFTSKYAAWLLHYSILSHQNIYVDTIELTTMLSQYKNVVLTAPPLALSVACDKTILSNKVTLVFFDTHFANQEISEYINATAISLPHTTLRIIYLYYQFYEGKKIQGVEYIQMQSLSQLYHYLHMSDIAFVSIHNDTSLELVIVNILAAGCMLISNSEHPLLKHVTNSFICKTHEDYTNALKIACDTHEKWWMSQQYVYIAKNASQYTPQYLSSKIDAAMKVGLEIIS